MAVNWYKTAQAPPPPPPGPPGGGPPPLPPMGGPPGGGPGTPPSPSEGRVGTMNAVHKLRIDKNPLNDKKIIKKLNDIFKEVYESSDQDDEDMRELRARIMTAQVAKSPPPEGLGLDIGGPHCLSIAFTEDEDYPGEEPPFVRGIRCPESATPLPGMGGAQQQGGPPPMPGM